MHSLHFPTPPVAFSTANPKPQIPNPFVFGVGPSFTPDTTMKGSSLAGWYVLGQADWKAQNGKRDSGTPALFMEDQIRRSRD